eukprot:15479601-Alexandrium_andersonii.AAC.1
MQYSLLSGTRGRRLLPLPPMQGKAHSFCLTTCLRSLPPAKDSPNHWNPLISMVISGLQRHGRQLFGGGDRTDLDR